MEKLASKQNVRGREDNVDFGNQTKKQKLGESKFEEEETSIMNDTSKIKKFAMILRRRNLFQFLIFCCSQR